MQLGNGTSHSVTAHSLLMNVFHFDFFLFLLWLRLKNNLSLKILCNGFLGHMAPYLMFQKCYSIFEYYKHHLDRSLLRIEAECLTFGCSCSFL